MDHWGSAQSTFCWWLFPTAATIGCPFLWQGDSRPWCPSFPVHMKQGLLYQAMVKATKSSGCVTSLVSKGRICRTNPERKVLLPAPDPPPTTPPPGSSYSPSARTLRKKKLFSGSLWNDVVFSKQNCLNLIYCTSCLYFTMKTPHKVAGQTSEPLLLVMLIPAWWWECPKGYQSFPLWGINWSPGGRKTTSSLKYI